MVNTSQYFLVLDSSDHFIVRFLSERSVDFRNLDEIDQKILAWLLAHSPNKLEGWLDFLASDYDKKTSNRFCLQCLKDYLYPLSEPLAPEPFRVYGEPDALEVY